MQLEGLRALLSPWIFCISIQKDGELHRGPISLALLLNYTVQSEVLVQMGLES